MMKSKEFIENLKIHTSTKRINVVGISLFKRFKYICHFSQKNAFKSGSKDWEVENWRRGYRGHRPPRLKGRNMSFFRLPQHLTKQPTK